MYFKAAKADQFQWHICIIPSFRKWPPHLTPCNILHWTMSSVQREETLVSLIYWHRKSMQRKITTFMSPYYIVLIAMSFVSYKNQNTICIPQQYLKRMTFQITTPPHFFMRSMLTCVSSELDYNRHYLHRLCDTFNNI